MSKKNLNKKLLAKVLVIGSGVLLAAAGGWMAYQYFYPKGDNAELWVADERGNLVAAADDASQAASGGDTERAQEIYDQAIANSENDDEELMLTVIKAQTLLSDNKHDEALSIAKSAENRWKKVDTAILLGDIYAAQDNKDEAKKHYQLAIERLDPSEYDHQSAKKMLQDKINNL